MYEIGDERLIDDDMALHALTQILALCGDGRPRSWHHEPRIDTVSHHERHHAELGGVSVPDGHITVLVSQGA